MLEPKVIYEDSNLLVINKPPGLQVHAAKISGAQAAHHAAPRPIALTVVDWLVKYYPEVKNVGDDPALRPGIVHRLDKETSGVMLVARNQKYFDYLKLLFQKHEIKKTYLAFVAGVPAKRQGIIDAPIGIRNGTMKRSIRSAKMAKPAVTEYRVLKTLGGEGGHYSLLEISPKTGRTHQIRVHLASIGHPVLGDRLYGPKKQPAWVDRLMLHALSVEFTAADGKRVKFEAAPPF
ncbi:MAG: RluA family pseudouridine synthase [Minisyncoccia bacterium]|jgi:23S rRNA pseudouridine1911/1915/1917 synthase